MQIYRRARIAGRLAALAIGGLGVLGPGAAAAEELVIPQDGTSYQLATRPQSRIQVPLDVRAGIDARSLRLTVLHVRRNAVQDVPASAFKPTYRANPPRISVAVDLAKASAAGTYDLSLRIASGRRVQRLGLQLVRPFATLEAPTTFIVERTLILPWWTKERTPPLRVAERSGALIAGASVRQVDAAAARFVFGPRPFTPSDAPPGTPASDVIQPNGSVDIAYSLGGSFPLGTATRTIEISAPQLQSSTKVTLQVRSRRHPAWIAVVVGLGLIAGWLLRTALQRWGELGRARLQALDLLDRLRQAHQDHQDADFRETVAGLVARVDALRSGQDWRDGTKIADTVKEAATTLDTALASLAKRRESTSSQLASTIELVDTRWSVPESVEAALTTARKELEAALEALEANDPGKALALRASIADDLDRAVQRATTEWREKVTADLRPLVDLNPRPGSPAFDLRRAAEQASTVVGEIPVAEPTSTASDLLPMLHAARWQVRQLPGQASALLQEPYRVRRALMDREIRDEAALAALDQAAADLMRELEELRGRPEATLAAIAKQVPRLVTALEYAIRKQIDVGGDPDVERLIGEGRYTEAAQQLRRAGAGDGRGEAVQPGKAPQEGLATAEAVAGTLLLPDTASPPPPRTSLLALHLPASEPEVRVERARAFSVILWSTWVQTALVFALLLVAGYLLFADEFVGTLRDIAQVFLWAFAIDVTVAKLLEVTQGLTAPAPTAATR